MSALTEWLSSSEQLDLRCAFIAWIRRVMVRRLPGVPMSGVHDLQEMRTMLAERMKQWEREFELRGQRKGESHLLFRLLQKRFGPLPAAARTRIEQAESRQLEQWGERLLDVDTLEALFEA